MVSGLKMFMLRTIKTIKIYLKSRYPCLNRCRLIFFRSNATKNVVIFCYRAIKNKSIYIIVFCLFEINKFLRIKFMTIECQKKIVCSYAHTFLPLFQLTELPKLFEYTQSHSCRRFNKKKLQIFTLSDNFQMKYNSHNFCKKIESLFSISHESDSLLSCDLMWFPWILNPANPWSLV
jgi:hypothetical protein